MSKRKEELCQRLFDVVPVGVGSTGEIRAKEFDEVLDQGNEFFFFFWIEYIFDYFFYFFYLFLFFLGIDWAIRENFAWPEDKV